MPGAAPGGTSFANAMRAQLAQPETTGDAPPATTAPATPTVLRGIFAARASPDIPTPDAIGSLPDPTNLNTSGDILRGNSLPPVGNILPPSEVGALIEELPAAATVSGEPQHGDIRVPVLPPVPAPAAAVADVRSTALPTDAIPAAPASQSVTGAITSDPPATILQFGQVASTTASTGEQSANADPDARQQSYRAIESAPAIQPGNDDTPVSRMPRFVIPSDTTTALTGFAPNSTITPGALPELTDTTLPPSMRTLQPTANPEVFSNGLGNRLMMMSRDGVQSARLKLHPENLGPLDVRIQIEDDGARVWFGAQHGQTREALEAAIPRLRELFAEQGMQLLRADVSAGHSREGSADETVNPAAPDVAASRDGAAGQEEPIPPSIMRVPDRLLDVYV